MTRIASKLLIVGAVVTGVVVAAANLNAGTGHLPEVPTTTAPNSVTTAATGDVVDLKDWQQTRIGIGTTSNGR